MTIPQLLFITGTGESSAIVERILRATNNNKTSPSSVYSEIFISGVHVDDPILQALDGALNNGNWNGIHIAHCSGLIQNLIEVACQCVQKLSLLNDFHRIDSTWCRAISSGLQRPGTKVKKLLLRVQLSHDLALALNKGTRSIHCKMEELILPISDSFTSSVILLSQGIRQSKTLKTLKLSRHDLMWTMDKLQIVTLMKALDGHNSLRELSIQGSACTESGIQAMSEYVLDRLERLDLSNHRFGGDQLHGVSSLTRALSNPNRLRFLTLSGHTLRQEDVVRLTDVLSGDYSKMEELHLNNCGLGDESVQIIGNKLPQMTYHLQYLFLRDNPFYNTGYLALCDGIQKNWEIKQLVIPRKKDVMDHVQKQIDLHLVLNQAGRKLLRTTTHPIPLSLWPKVLHRASTLRHNGYYISSKSSAVNHADAIFNLLKGPALLQR